MEAILFIGAIVGIYAGYHLIMSILIEKVKERNRRNGIE